MIQIDIFMVAYKRPTILDYTLEQYAKYFTPSKKVYTNLYVWCNEAGPEDLHVVQKYDFISHAVLCPDNLGKAHALNTMFEDVSSPDHYILTMDQDMVFTAPFMPILEDAVDLRFDILGFASKQYWCHIPYKEDVTHFPWRNYELYYTRFIAGGIMLLPGKFLANHKWTNEDGIYGGDDYNMCLSTDDKFILEHDSEWLIHDPLMRSTPELDRYESNKKFYLNQGLHVLPKGWNSDTPD